MQTDQEKMIGIVGGVGPYAGLDLAQKVFNQTIASKDQDHLPVALLSFAHKISDRTQYLLGEIEQNPASAIAEIILTLEKAGAEIVGIPCNTAHSPRIFTRVLQELQKANSQITLLHMIDEVAAFILENYPDVQKVGVLSTTGTKKTRIYQDQLEEKGLQVITPDDDLQTLVHDAIYNPKVGIKVQANPVSAEAKQKLLDAGSVLKQEGAELIILGCTEIPLAITEKTVAGINVIDPALILARSLIKKAAPHKLKVL